MNESRLSELSGHCCHDASCACAYGIGSCTCGLYAMHNRYIKTGDPAALAIVKQISNANRPMKKKS